MWIIEWSYPNDGEFNTTGWASEEQAFKSACADIINHIDSLDPQSDDELLTSAEIINDFIKAKQYEQAISHWNDCDYNIDHSDGAMYWVVSELTPQYYNGEPPLLSLGSSEDEEEETTKPFIIVDDHTCSLCGNTKCSKREASCWSCGHPIS